MAGEISEKTEAHSHRSSHGGSTDGLESTGKEHTKAHAETSPSPSEEQALAKLDSKRHVEVKDEDIYAHLSKEEAEVLKRQVDIPTVKTGWKTLYRYSTTNDVIIMIISAICAIAAGAALPLMTIIFGNLAGEFNGYFAGTVSHGDFEHTITHMGTYILALLLQLPPLCAPPI
jgi:ATP-binding cassette subfamily B (MDR/TAP) protein 1